jgi:type II secretory pathway pseudopilin PulG
MSSPGKQTAAFTLLELLAGISIAAVLAVLLSSALFDFRSKAVEAKCVQRLRATGVAVAGYTADHAGKLPVNGGIDPVTGAYGRFFFLVGPYLSAVPAGVGSAAYYRNLATFRCPVFDEKPGQQYIWRYNPLVGNVGGSQTPSNVHVSVISRPDSLPLCWDISGDTGGGNVFVPHPKAKEFGYSGPTSITGLMPNHGTCCNVLFVSGRVAPVDVSDLENFPWNGVAPGKSGVGSVFDPSYNKMQ